MPQSASQIVIGANGSVRVAPVGTVAPVDVATAWGASWIDLGLLNEDGVTFRDGKTVADVTAWQLFYPARKTITGRDSSVSFVLRQWSKDTVPLAFGGGTITTTAGPPIHYLYTPPAPGALDERALGIEWIDGTKIYRLVIPRGIVTEEVETNVTKADAADLPITFGILGSDASAPWVIRTNDASFAAS